MYEAMSIVIALFALGVSIWNAHRTSRHNDLSVRPLLSIKTDLMGEDEGLIGVRLSNEKKTGSKKPTKSL